MPLQYYAVIEAPTPYGKYSINPMKNLKCDLCEATAKGEIFEAWMDALKPHYGVPDAEVMNDFSKTKEDMEKWLAENKARFEAAPVINTY